MNYKAEFKGWNQLTLSDLIVAYRKAKADQFFENSFPTAAKFAEYEQDLLNNLKLLLAKLQKNRGFHKTQHLLGDCRLLPKKLSREPKEEVSNGHTHFSDHDREFEHLKESYDIELEFRIVGDFPVDTHIISALWINMVGHKFDACLDDSCYGARLRRIRNEEVIDKKAEKPFHITAIGSFAPYYQHYQKWRADGLNAIRNELEQDRKVVAVSLDLRSYYHLLDPMMVTSDAFQEEIGLQGEKSLSDEERDFTKHLGRLMDNWAKQAGKFAEQLGCKLGKVNGGLVIGLTASRIIANVVLHKWDKLIREKITPIHYGRYIDDMFLVLRDPGTIRSSALLMSFIQERLGKKRLTQAVVGNKLTDTWRIELGKKYQKKSLIELQAQKQKLFMLDGQGGCDLLDSIEKEISELSSEQRLMPSPDQLEHSTAARVLSAAGSIGEGADSLRRADGLTVRRLGWSLQLRHVETLAHDLPAGTWHKQRHEFYQFAHNHILRPEQIFAHYMYLPRLLGFAVGMGEWGQAEAIVKRSFHCIDQLEQLPTKSKVKINGYDCLASNLIWNCVRGSLAAAFIDAAAKHYNPSSLLSNKPHWKESKLAEIFMAQLWNELNSVNFLEFPINSDTFYEIAPLLAQSDLARMPYKELLKGKFATALIKKRDKKKEQEILKKFKRTSLIDVDSLKQFLHVSKEKRLPTVSANKSTDESIDLPYLFPTRPYSATEVAELAPQCVGLETTTSAKPQSIWAKYVRAVRGVWVKPALLDDEIVLNDRKLQTKPQSRKRLRIGTQKKKSVVVAITNLLTEDSSWGGTASGKPELTLERYKRICDLVNQALTVRPKPDYLILPELSLPLEWVNSIASRLLGAGISLIAGTEYRHYGGNKIRSEACLVLTDDRLGFPSSVRIWQPKIEPAVGEDRELTSKLGKTWKPPYSRRKPIYIHNDVHLGVMVCSELQNSQARIQFQGEIDALMVLSWNQDLDTFASLIESAALDVHAYTILVNNRKYGDSRVRAPSKESFRRDLARVRGGANDFCVVVDLDIDSLRAFQSRAKRWPEKNDPFKPVPEGFRIRSSRRRLPPK
ncbi:RNA-directed DNA polymerase [Paenalcaligenes sp. Me52]|uniref:RNA-directed DNA polymerase n=1 Tax=Paenalcaligenes sp. Me52 TaxID=3392038 RepID=UPI003D2E32BE